MGVAWGHRPVLLSVVILTWNSARSVGRALTSLVRDVKGIPAEVVVVDNGSVDNSVRVVQETVPAARIIQNRSNQGVARARNQGLSLAAGTYVLFLDSDTEILPGSVGELLGFMGDHPQVGIVGPKLVYPDGRAQVSCRRFPTLQGKVGRQLPLHLQTMVPWIADEEMHDLDRTVAHSVDYVIGACQLIRRMMIEDIGRLDERMFYGPEDVDFCLRAWKAGWEVYYVPSAVVVHHEQRIARRLSMLTLRHGMALGYYFWKHRYLWRRPERPRLSGGGRR